MTETEAKIVDLINFSSKQKPIEFEATFKELIQDRVASAIDNKKIEIAKTMYSAPEIDSEEEQELETESEEETEEQEDGEAA